MAEMETKKEGEGMYAVKRDVQREGEYVVMRPRELAMKQGCVRGVGCVYVWMKWLCVHCGQWLVSVVTVALRQSTLHNVDL